MLSLTRSQSVFKYKTSRNIYHILTQVPTKVELPKIFLSVIHSKYSLIKEQTIQTIGIQIKVIKELN